MERDGAGDDGLVVAMYSPAVVKHTLKNGLEVMLSIETDYPFDDKVTINASCGKGMILSFRVPSWTGSSNVVVNGSLLLKPPMLGKQVEPKALFIFVVFMIKLVTVFIAIQHCYILLVYNLHCLYRHYL